MSIFSGCKSYKGKWEVTSIEPISKEDIEAVESAHIVNSQYGLSVCFVMKAGNVFYKPVDQNSTCSVGDVVDLTKAKSITLSKQGEADIIRIRV